MAPSRKTLKFAGGGVVSDRQLWAIGLVCVEWSMVEFNMRTFADALMEDNQAERDRYRNTFVLRQRLKMLRGWVEEKIIEPWQTELLKILSRIGETAQQRDLIVHGIWGGPPLGVPVDAANPPEAEKMMNLRRAPSPQSRVSYSGVMDVARKIDDINAAFIEFQMKANGTVPFTTTSALQRISRR